MAGLDPFQAAYVAYLSAVQQAWAAVDIGELTDDLDNRRGGVLQGCGQALSTFGTMASIGTIACAGGTFGTFGCAGTAACGPIPFVTDWRQGQGTQACGLGFSSYGTFGCAATIGTAGGTFGTIGTAATFGCAVTERPDGGTNTGTQGQSGEGYGDARS